MLTGRFASSTTRSPPNRSGTAFGRTLNRWRRTLASMWERRSMRIRRRYRFPQAGRLAGHLRESGIDGDSNGEAGQHRHLPGPQAHHPVRGRDGEPFQHLHRRDADRTYDGVLSAIEDPRQEGQTRENSRNRWNGRHLPELSSARFHACRCSSEPMVYSKRSGIGTSTMSPCSAKRLSPPH